jgi:glutamate racemase
LPVLKAKHRTLPLIGVVEPGADAAVRATRNGRIAVIATESTVRGGAYQRAIAARRPDAQVSAVAAGLFVALAEEGWVEGDIAESVAAKYLAPLFTGGSPPDTLVLGCTHFPPLLAAIRAVVGTQVSIVDSAATTARALAALIAPMNLLRGADHGSGVAQFLVTDGIERFLRTGPGFLGSAIEPARIERVDLQEGSA